MSSVGRWVHFLHLHFIVFLWGFTGVLGDLISVRAFELVWYRMLLAGIGMWMLFRWNRLSWPEKTTLRNIALTGVVVGLHWICFYSAIKVSNVSVALASFSSTSLFTSLIEPLYFKRKIRRLEVYSGILVVVAMVVIFFYELHHWQGILLGIAAAVTASWFTVLNGLWAKKADGGVISAVEMSSGFLALSIFMLLKGSGLPDFQISVSDWMYLLVLAGVCTIYTFIASIRLMKHFKPFDLSLAVNMEPIYGMLMAVVFLGKKEMMSGGFYAGAALVMLTVFGTAWLKRKS